MRAFCKQLDEVLHPACAVITYAIGARPGLLAKPKAEVDALINNIPDEARRTHRAMVIKEGIHAPIFTTALAQYLQILGRAEARLAQTPYLAGEQISLPTMVWRLICFVSSTWRWTPLLIATQA